jgi:YD repeat-containing protein
MSTIDVAGVKSHFEWSESGELLAEKVGNTLTRYSYDKLGRLNALIDAQGLVTVKIWTPTYLNNCHR